MNFPAIKYSQSSYNLVTTVLPFRVVNNKSKTLIYGKDEGGYQRIQDEKHFQNIRKYIDEGDFIFPNSIILAIDETDFKNIVLSTKDTNINLELNEKKEILFRVVDGQHRLLGIEQAAKKDSTLYNLSLNVSIIVTPTNKRSIEMEIFSNINSKAKRLKTDLIELAKYDFRIIEQKIGARDLNPHIAINTAFKLNEDYSEKNVWQNAIKIDIHAENKIGIIGVKAFSEAIYGIVGSYMSKFPIVNKLDDNDLISFSREAAEVLSKFLINSWTIVSDRWPNTFLDPYKVLDIDDQYRTIAYDPNFYIQKTLGCKAINYLMSDILRDNFDSIFSTDSLVKFEEIIYNSKLNDLDWQLGKTLSGLSSESGFKKVTKILRNEEKFVRKE